MTHHPLASRSFRERLNFLATALTAIALWPAAGVSQTWPATRPASLPSRADVARLPSQGKIDIRVHDPSHIVQCNGQYWMFCTGNGVRSLHSPDLLHWDYGPPVIGATPAWAKSVVPAYRGLNLWAPDIVERNGQYCCYYCVSTFGKNISAIGLATNATLDNKDPKFKWVDQGVVMTSVASERFNAIDPDVITDQQGRVWMSFGSFWGGIKMIELDARTGKRIAPDSRIYSLAYTKQIEGSCIYHRGDYYYLMLNWGLCCRGIGSTYTVEIGRSKTVTGPYLDKSGKDMMQGGGTLLMDSDGAFIGPGHAKILDLGNDRFVISCHFYDGSTPRGDSKLSIRPMHWDADEWPVVDLARSSIAP